MGCMRFGIVGFGRLVVALRPLAPVAMRLMDVIASQLDEAPERELVPIRVVSRPNP